MAGGRVRRLATTHAHLGRIWIDVGELHVELHVVASSKNNTTLFDCNTLVSGSRRC